MLKYIKYRFTLISILLDMNSFIMNQSVTSIHYWDDGQLGTRRSHQKDNMNERLEGNWAIRKQESLKGERATNEYTTKSEEKCDERDLGWPCGKQKPRLV